MSASIFVGVGVASLFLLAVCHLLVFEFVVASWCLFVLYHGAVRGYFVLSLVQFL